MANKIENYKLPRLITAAAKAGRTRISDGDGLYLLVGINGGDGSAWRFDYAVLGTPSPKTLAKAKAAGKPYDARPRLLRKTMSLGLYPRMSLTQARDARNNAQAIIDAGGDPLLDRKTEVVARKEASVNARLAKRGLPPVGSFAEVFNRWHAVRSPDWSATYSAKVRQRIEARAIPMFGHKPIDDIDRQEVLQCLRLIEAEGYVESAHAVAQYISQVFDFAVDEGIARNNPADTIRRVLRGVQVEHQPAITDPNEFAAMLHAIAGYRGDIKTKIALLVAASTMQRPANVRGMQWAHLDLDAGMWSIPSMLMKRTVEGKKNGPPHEVALAPEVVGWLRELHPLTGRTQFVFPCSTTDDKCMSENTMNSALALLGYKGRMVSHGFRAAGRSILAEHLHVRTDALEEILAHGKQNPLGDTYDRAIWLQQRRDALNLWGRVVAHAAATGRFKVPAAPAPQEGTDVMVAAIERLTGQRVSPEALKAALAAPPAPARAAKAASRPRRAASRV